MTRTLVMVAIALACLVALALGGVSIPIPPAGEGTDEAIDPPATPPQPTVVGGAARLTVSGYGTTGQGRLRYRVYVKKDGPAALGNWATASAAAPEREDAASVAHNGYAYVIGGKPNSGVAQASIHYAKLNADGSTRTWATTTALPAARQDHNAVVAGERIYVVGGGGPDATVYSAPTNPGGTLGAWRSERSLPLALDDPASVIAGDYLYVTGGFNGPVRGVVYRARIEVDGSLGGWQTEANALPDGGRTEHTAFADSGFLYVVGGGNPDVQDDVFYAPITADGSLGAWQTEADELPQARLDHTTVVSGGRVYVIGGVNGSPVAQSTVYSAPLNADGSTGAWVSEPALPAAREDATTVMHGGYAYVFAGKSGSVVTTTYSARLPAAFPTIPTIETAAIPVVVEPLRAGSYVVRVTAVDGAGRVSAVSPTSEAAAVTESTPTATRDEERARPRDDG